MAYVPGMPAVHADECQGVRCARFHACWSPNAMIDDDGRAGACKAAEIRKGTKGLRAHGVRLHFTLIELLSMLERCGTSRYVTHLNRAPEKMARASARVDRRRPGTVAGRIGGHHPRLEHADVLGVTPAERRTGHQELSQSQAGGIGRRLPAGVAKASPYLQWRSLWHFLHALRKKIPRLSEVTGAHVPHVKGVEVHEPHQGSRSRSRLPGGGGRDGIVGSASSGCCMSTDLGTATWSCIH